MSQDYLPRSDPKLLNWTSNFSTLITLSPEAYGITTGIASNYSGLYDAFASALTNATAPATRGPATILIKDEARETLVDLTRQVARMIQGNIGVTNEQRQSLGLTVRKPVNTPQPAPTESPNIDIISVSGNTVSTKLHDGSGTRRGKPPMVNGASVFSFIGPAPAADISDWKFESNVSRTTFDLVFPSDTMPGAKVWITAFWFNERKQSGPATPPVSTNLQGGGVSQAA